MVQAVYECIKVLALGGGYILAPSHNLFERCAVGQRPVHVGNGPQRWALTNHDLTFWQALPGNASKPILRNGGDLATIMTYPSVTGLRYEVPASQRCY